MKELPLSVVIAALVKDNKILLIQRARGSYVGYWALPGGKIEKQEHLSQAATREILEESGIQSEFKEHLGFVLGNGKYISFTIKNAKSFFY